MKKIPTLFERKFENHKIVGITDKITPGCEEAFLHGEATVKYDGSCCAILNGEFYKRYDAKKGKKAPEGAIPCCDPDPITGHHPHWVKVNPEDPADRWFVVARDNFIEDGSFMQVLASKHLFDLDNMEINEHSFDGTYEALGPHFQGNPYKFDYDVLCKHGDNRIIVKRTFDDVKAYLEENNIEGIVFWLNGEPVCKIKRSDFGFKWPV